MMLKKLKIVRGFYLLNKLFNFTMLVLLSQVLFYCGNASSLFLKNSSSSLLSDFQAENQYRSGEISLQIVTLSESVNQGIPLKVQYKLSNLSSKPIKKSFLVSFYASRDSSLELQNDTWLFTEKIELLKAKSQKLYTSRLNIASSFGTGEWYLFAFADVSNQIQELEEDDNLQGPWPFSVNEGKLWTDLQCSSVTTKDNFLADQIVLQNGSSDTALNVRIINAGDIPLYQEFFDISFALVAYPPTAETLDTYPYYKNAVEIAGGNNWDISKDFILSPGQSYNQLLYPDLSSGKFTTGWYLLYTKVDSYNTITEKNENNNASDRYNAELVIIKN